MTDRIIEKLNEIERSKNVRILHAVESGGRAGFIGRTVGTGRRKGDKEVAGRIEPVTGRVLGYIRQITIKQ